METVNIEDVVSYRIEKGYMVLDFVVFDVFVVHTSIVFAVSGGRSRELN